MQRRKANPDDIKVSLSVSPGVWERLRQLALQQRRSLNDLLNEWIAEKLEPASNIEPQSDEGRKGGTVYASGGLPAMRTCDRPG